MERFHNAAVVGRQLSAMGMVHFDIAVRRTSGTISALREGLLVAQVKDLCEWLHEQNQKQHAILIRPHGEHGMSLLSALRYQQVQACRIAGFEPALLVEYAADRYQIWLKHDRKLPLESCELATRYLAERAGADVKAAHWDSFGYLAGFTVPAPGAEGEPFPVQLAEASGAVYRQAREIGERFVNGWQGA